jgi:CRISPR-associated protein Cas5h
MCNTDKTKTLCFKLYGDFGHFRPYFTTTSPITYTIIPPTSVMGVIGAILGFDKKDNEYYRLLKKAGTRVGIGIKKRMKKKCFGINLINTKGNYWVPTSRNSNGPRSPTRFEYVIKPEYFIYVTMRDEKLLEKLSAMIKEHKSFYSVSLGLASLLADFKFIMFDTAIKVDIEEPVEVSSVVPLDLLANDGDIKVENGHLYCKERFVRYFAEDRVPQSYVDVLYTHGEKKAVLRPSEVYLINGTYFTFIT